MTLTGAFKPTARLIIPIVLLHLLINPLQCVPHVRLVFISIPKSRMCCTRCRGLFEILYSNINGNLFLVMDNTLHLSMLKSIPQI